jgi:hypothetical protein
LAVEVSRKNPNNSKTRYAGFLSLLLGQALLYRYLATGFYGIA